jgi:hypothetical protein
MYYMIHATDHPEAPTLMSRAYRQAVHPLGPLEELQLDLFRDTEPRAPSPQPAAAPVEKRIAS